MGFPHGSKWKDRTCCLMFVPTWSLLSPNPWGRRLPTQDLLADDEDEAELPARAARRPVVLMAATEAVQSEKRAMF
jgi:hypothetical protein